ncbi:MAG: TetR/AcrR family transcriptional regulator [Bacteroidota bacterium]
MSTSTRQLILQRCFEAIQAKGFETLRTDKEIARLKITKGAFYHYFPNKAELGYAVVDEVMLPYYEQKWASLANIEIGVAEALIAVLEQEKTKATETSIKRGDVLTNMILEMSHVDDIFRQKLEVVNEVQVKIIQKAIMSGRIAGELKNQTDARSMALYIVGQLMGCYTISKVRASKETFVSMVGTMQKQLKDVLVAETAASKVSDVTVNTVTSPSGDRPKSTIEVVNPFAKPEEKTEEKSTRGGWFSRNR